VPASSDEPKVISALKQDVFDNGPEGLGEILETRIRGAWQEQGFFKVIATAQTQIISSDSAYEHVVVTIHVRYRVALGRVGRRLSESTGRVQVA